MNIIKIKDKLFDISNESFMEAFNKEHTNETLQNTALGYKDYFDEMLKGKYVWLVHMRYIVPMEVLDINSYWNAEDNIRNIIGDVFKANNELWTNGNNIDPNVDPQAIVPPVQYIDIHSWVGQWIIHEYADESETERINSISSYMISNQMSPGTELTEDQINVFRTWLASQIHEAKDALMLTDMQDHVMQYYMNGTSTMVGYDDTVRWLNEISSSAVTKGTTNITTCGCVQRPDLATLIATPSITVCDPLKMYRESMYNTMVILFSDYLTWQKMGPVWLELFKNYIDTIIKMNKQFSYTQDQWSLIYKECGCAPTDTFQTHAMQMLRALSQSIQYLIDGQLDTHRNFISTSLTQWATYLYEKMYWV